MNSRPKEPLLALMITFIFSGLGQVYAGYPKRGFIFISVQIVSVVGLGIYVINPETKMHILLLSPVVIYVLFSLYIIVDSYRCARKFNQDNNLERKISVGKRVLLLIGILFFLVGPNISTPLTIYLRSNVIQAFRFPSGSMQPTIVEGDRLLADKRVYKKTSPQRGDLIVFVYPQDETRDFLKRLIAIGGDKVEIRNGDIYINDNLVTDSRIKDRHYYNRGDFGQEGNSITVPEGQYYVLGDNSASSHDSRFWGFVPEENLIGKIYKIYWPPERSGPID